MTFLFGTFAFGDVLHHPYKVSDFAALRPHRGNRLFVNVGRAILAAIDDPPAQIRAACTRLRLPLYEKEFVTGLRFGLLSDVAVRTARTGRKLGIISDARYRCERGVDPEFVVPGLELATKLILEWCGGEAPEDDRTVVVIKRHHESAPAEGERRTTGTMPKIAS